MANWLSGANNRPIAVLVVALALLSLPLETHVRPVIQTSSAPFDPQGEAELLALTNQARGEQGLPPLKIDPRLTQAARKHTALMAQRSQMEHQLPGEPPVPIRIANEGLAADATSENIAFSNRSVQEAHEGLMHSPPHRRAILDPGYDVVGIGVLRDGNSIWIAEDFAHTIPEYSAAQAESVVQAAIARYAELHKFYAPARRSEPELRRMACDMARRDRLDREDALHLPGVRSVLAWTASDPAQLPKRIGQALPGQASADALGVCFARSRSHPGGVYWIVMVTYWRGSGSAH